MKDYYSKNLNAGNLEKCYQIAPPRIKQYMKAEMDYVLDHIQPNDTVIDLGCGYGRTLPAIAEKAGFVIGIDNSLHNLQMAKNRLKNYSNIFLAIMDAELLGLPDQSMDTVVCIQNGISAFKVEPIVLIRETIRLTKPDGKILFSTYSEKIWEERLDWFVKQSNAGLLGEIDWDLTGDGTIVCKDGFRATTFTSKQMLDFVTGAGHQGTIVEVDSSSMFVVISP